MSLPGPHPRQQDQGKGNEGEHDTSFKDTARNLLTLPLIGWNVSHGHTLLQGRLGNVVFILAVMSPAENFY